jgi:hypothetical protein
MGCDIHTYLELYSKKESKQSKHCWVNSISKIHFGRNYNLFSLMAGVRGCSKSIYPVKGVPTSPNMSYSTSSQYYATVIDDKDLNLYGERNTNVIVRSQAEELVSKGITSYGNFEKTKIANPDYHTASWLNIDELAHIRKEYLIQNIEYYSNFPTNSLKKRDLLAFVQGKDPISLLSFCFHNYEDEVLYSTINMMNSLEKCSVDDDNVARVVFWFDS